MECIEGFSSVLEQYEVPKDRTKLLAFAVKSQDKHNLVIKNKDPRWLDRHKAQALKVLRSLQFFNRFTLQRQIQILDKIDLHFLKSNQLLLFNPKLVYVVVSGSIMVKNHQQNLTLPQTFAKFDEGSVLNYLQDKLELYNQIDTWFVTQVDTELVSMDKDYFEELQADLIQNEKQVLLTALSCNPLFGVLNRLTLMTLVYEIFEERSFVRGDCIIPQTKQAPTNEKYAEFFKTQQSKMSAVIMHKRGLKEQQSSTSSQGYQGTEEKTISINNRRRTTIVNFDDIASYRSARSRMGSQTNMKTDALQPLKDLHLHQIVEEEDVMGSDQESSAYSLLQEEEADGIYLIQEGQCCIFNNTDKFEAKILRRGDFFGESDPLKVIGYEYFGDICAVSDKVVCLHIPSEKLKKIPLFEQLVIKQFCQNRDEIKMLSYMYSTRYELDIKLFASYYGSF